MGQLIAEGKVALTVDDLYSDLNIDNPLDSGLVTGLDAVYGALENILSTDKRGRVFNLDVTAQLEEHIMDALSSDTASSIYGLIANALNQMEPRVALSHNGSWVRPNMEQNGYDVRLQFSIVGLGDQNVEAVTMFLEKP